MSSLLNILRHSVLVSRLTKTYSTSHFTMTIVTFEQIVDLPNRPEVVLVDVREPVEIHNTGNIPTAINIPCKWLFFSFVSVSGSQLALGYRASRSSFMQH